MSDQYWRWGKYFKPTELLSPIGLIQYEQSHNLMLSEVWLDTLYGLREWVGLRFQANGKSWFTGNYNKFRGFRSSYENKGVGGVSLSRHMQGIATDISTHPDDMPIQVLFQKANEYAENTKTIGAIFYYPNRNLIHVDGRPIVKKIKSGVIE